jgi:flagellar basal-body rod modification protein FlgD
MAIDALSASGQSASGLNLSRVSIAENFDTFLSILVTQLKHQNPLEPLDTNEFTSQLVQFSSVEQQLKTNEYLQALIVTNQSVSATQATGFIGKRITATGATSELSNGLAQWQYTVGSDAPQAAVTIRNLNGTIVYSGEMSAAAGSHVYSWNGIGNDGSQQPAGTYSITIAATDADGNYVPVSTQTSGTVTGVDFTDYEPILLVGGSRIRLSSVTEVSGS